MRKINSPGNVSNLFVDYDPINNPLGTVYSADWGNDVQTDLIEIQEFAGLPEAAGASANVLKSIIKIAKEQGKEIGEHFFLDSYKAPAEFDPTDTDTAQLYFPSLCLSTIDIQTTISTTNWALLVPHLRALKLTYLEELTGEVSAFACGVSGSTVTLDNTTANNKLLLALAKWVLSHGSYTNWITLTIGGTEYPITNINTTTRAITVTGSPASSSTVEFYPHRIAASTTTARVFAVTGKSLISANDVAGLFIGGVSMLGYMQGVRFSAGIAFGSSDDSFVYGNTTDDIPGVSNGVIASRAAGTANRQPLTSLPRTDGTNGTPRTSSETHSPSSVKHLYIFGRTYEA